MKKLYLIDGVLQMLEIPQNDSIIENEFLAIKESNNFNKHSKRIVYKLIRQNDNYYFWKSIESQCPDKSPLDTLYIINIASAILRMQKDGFTVTKNGILIEPLKD